MHDDESTDTPSTERVGGKARSLLNLAPRWQPGQSGNPSGLAKDGGGTKDHPARALLRAKLAKRRALHRLVDAWIHDAIDGEDGATRARAREQILDRIDPVTVESTEGRTVLEGISLSLTPGGGAQVTIARQSSSSGESVVVNDESESRAGGSRVDSLVGGSPVPDLPALLQEAPESLTPEGPSGFSAGS